MTSVDTYLEVSRWLILGAILFTAYEMQNTIREESPITFKKVMIGTWKGNLLIFVFHINLARLTPDTWPEYLIISIIAMLIAAAMGFAAYRIEKALEKLFK